MLQNVFQRLIEDDLNKDLNLNETLKSFKFGFWASSMLSFVQELQKKKKKKRKMEEKEEENGGTRLRWKGKELLNE